MDWKFGRECVCVCKSTQASHLHLFLPMCHTTVCSYLAVMVPPMSKHASTHIPYTQSNISVNETGGPLLHRVHTVLSVSVTAGEERAREHRSSSRERGKKDGSPEEGEGRGVVDTAHCHCYSPLQKMATSIKSLMIPALCPGGVGERGLNVWARESWGVMQSRGEIMEWVMERKRHRDRQRKGKERGKRGSSIKVSGKQVKERRMNAVEQPSEGWRCRETEWTRMCHAFSIRCSFPTQILFLRTVPTTGVWSVMSLLATGAWH